MNLQEGEQQPGLGPHACRDTEINSHSTRMATMKLRRKQRQMRGIFVTALGVAGNLLDPKQKSPATENHQPDHCISPSQDCQ